MSYINISNHFIICAAFFISVTIFWGSQRIPLKLYWDLEARNNPSFSIFRSLSKIQHKFMYIDTLRLSTLIIYYSKIIFYVTSLIIYAPKRFQFVITLSKSHHRRGGKFWNQLCNITVMPNKSVHPISLQQIKTLYWS